MFTSPLAPAFTAPSLEWRLDTGIATSARHRRYGRPLGVLVAGIGVLWIGIAWRTLSTGAGAGGELAPYQGQIALAIGAALVLWASALLVRRQTIHLDRRHVHVSLRRLTGTARWSEPLAAYRGVTWRTERVRRGDGWRTVQLVDLWHADPSRTLTLFSSTDESAARDAWHAWARALDLAAIRRWQAPVVRTALARRRPVAARSRPGAAERGARRAA